MKTILSWSGFASVLDQVLAGSGKTNNKFFPSPNEDARWTFMNRLSAINVNIFTAIIITASHC